LINFSLFKEQMTLWDPADKSYWNRGERKKNEEEIVELVIFCYTC